MAVSRRASRLMKGGGLAALLVGAWIVWRTPAAQQLMDPEHLAVLRERLQDPWWSPLAFVAVYGVLAAVDFSGLLLTLAGGVVYGFTGGVVLNTLGANLGANAAYALARGLGRDAVAALLGERFSHMQRLSETGGFVWLLRLRLLPVVPFNLLNLAGGLAAMPWRSFAAATALGILPGTIIYTLFADAIVRGSAEASHQAFLRLILAGALLVLLTFAPAAARRAGWIGPGR